MKHILKALGLQIKEPFARLIWRFSTLNKKNKSLFGVVMLGLCLLGTGLAWHQRQHQQEKLRLLRVDERALMDKFAEFKALTHADPAQLNEPLLMQMLQEKGLQAKQVEWKGNAISILLMGVQFSPVIDFLADMQKRMRWHVNTARTGPSAQNNKLKPDGSVNLQIELVPD